VFRDEVRRLARLPFVEDWAVRYADIEARTPLHDPGPLLDALAERGANLVVISEGLADVQQAKLARLGLSRLCAGRILITQNAGDIPGLDELDRSLEPFLNDTGDDFDDSTRTEFALLWRFRCVAHLWATKSPWFYGRCLHALHANPTAPASALRELAVVPRDAWRDDPMRFVMIGDRYDRDIAPLCELVGPQACLTIRLRAGRYADEFRETKPPPDRRLSWTFTNWNELTTFLTNDLCRREVPSLAAMPPIVDSSHLGRDILDIGHDSPHEAARHIARAVALILA
jgi:hypothetical protein